jgi:LPPG:FO 2-phospho-L-lactate transferase
VTADLTRRLELRAELLPMTDWPVRTKVRTDAGWLAFQDYFVRRGHEDDVRELRLDGIEAASATAEAMLAVAEAELLIIAPSNPFLSVGPILAVRGIIETIRRSRPRTVAVSPIVGGRALRGPADRLLESLGGEASAVGVARHYVERYPGLLQAFVIDWRDVGQLEAIEALGLRVLVTDTVMSSDEDRAVLARRILGFMSRGPGRRRR